MTKQKILLLFSFITLFVTYSCANEHSAENFINQYIRYTLTQSMTEGFDPRPYYHPDAVWIAGDRPEVRVVTSFDIRNIEDKRMNRNYINPKEEQISVVTVDFNTIGYISEYNQQKGSFISEESLISVIYYLSYSHEEKPLIITMTNSFIKFIKLEIYEGH